MLLFALALLAAEPSALEAAERAAGKRGTPVAPAGPSRQLQALAQNCDAHKFETMVEITSGGTTKHSLVKLCGTEGQSDADWIGTLKDAVAKTIANDKMPPAVRQQIVTAINAEIARLQGAPAPAAPSAAVAALPPPRSTAKIAPMQDYNSLPPLPDSPPPAVHVLPGASAALPALPKPRMSFICLTPGQVGEGPCGDFSRDTFLTIRADEDLPKGTSLRFVLSGETKADVELAQLKRGRSVRMTLPTDVCTHTGGGSLEIRIVRVVPATGPSGMEVDQEGPYNLRC